MRGGRGRSDPAQAGLAISLDPQASIGDPVVTCGVNQTGLMRVAVGHDCPLWKADAPCRWSVSAQAFQGLGCVTAPVTRAATTHLTTFGVGPVPQVEVASPADLVAFTADDLRRLTSLIVTLAALFAGMHALSWLVAYRDINDMERAAALSCTPELGCTELPNGLRVWRLEQHALGGDVDAVAGTAVNFAALVGIPFGRLALAVPEQLFGGQPPRHATGRAGGVAPSALEASGQRRKTYGGRFTMSVSTAA